MLGIAFQNNLALHQRCKMRAGGPNILADVAGAACGAVLGLWFLGGLADSSPYTQLHAQESSAESNWALG